MNEKLLSYIKKYVITFALMIFSSVFILFLRENSSVVEMQLKFLNFADAFTIPGVIVLMIGVLAWVSSKGNFDMLTYGFSRAKNAFIPSPMYKDEKFYDYKVRKDQKRIKGYGFLFIAGGVYMIPAIVFNILYYFAG